MNAPVRLQGGFTLVELVTSIVIFSVATIGLMLAVSASLGRSADPMIEIQATAIAKAYLEEATRANFCDPSYNPDNNTATTCQADCTGRACASGCGGSAFGAESGRASYDDVCDYGGLTDVGPRNRAGSTLPALSSYTVSVQVLDTLAVSLGSPALAATAGQVVRVDVTVNHAALRAPIVMSAYKANTE